MTAEPHHGRPNASASRARLPVVVLGAGGLLAVSVGLSLLIVRQEHGAGGATIGIGVMTLGAATAMLAKRFLPPPEQTEDRHAPGSPACIHCDHDTMSPSRRRLLAGASVAAVVGGVTGGAFFVRGRYGARDALRDTAWRRGDALVTIDGRRVALGDLSTGALLTVWPEGAEGTADAQAVLLRIDPRRLASEPRFDGWAPEGHVAYSKLCTHMGCPIGLSQQDPDVLVCPCHQAVFDVFDGARPVRGPARRPLPALPLMIAADGSLRARGGFTDSVGPGWWGRPR